MTGIALAHVAVLKRAEGKKTVGRKMNAGKAHGVNISGTGSGEFLKQRGVHFGFELTGMRVGGATSPT